MGRWSIVWLRLQSLSETDANNERRGRLAKWDLPLVVTIHMSCCQLLILWLVLLTFLTPHDSATIRSNAIAPRRKHFDPFTEKPMTVPTKHYSGKGKREAAAIRPITQTRYTLGVRNSGYGTAPDDSKARPGGAFQCGEQHGWRRIGWSRM